MNSVCIKGGFFAFYLEAQGARPTRDSEQRAKVNEQAASGSMTGVEEGD